MCEDGGEAGSVWVGRAVSMSTGQLLILTDFMSV